MRWSQSPESTPRETHCAGYTPSHRNKQIQVTTGTGTETGYRPATQAHNSHTAPGAPSDWYLQAWMGPYHDGKPGQVVGTSAART
uniref:Cold inducible RNA binding protein n=1 Tax=Pipistrellus kuhlii TaxID=59472 RepID=A0A7J7X9H9_PIPKU|nr:cold inducible RNA binding protein [Pipistrellus kuhlii]